MLDIWEYCEKKDLSQGFLEGETLDYKTFRVRRIAPMCAGLLSLLVYSFLNSDL